MRSVSTPPLSRPYERVDGTAVMRIETINYWVEDLDGISTLMRRVDQNASQPIAQDVAGFNITYFDDAIPPAEFVPDTVEEQTRIRVVEVELAIETAQERLNAGDKPVFALRTRISPRAMAINL